MKYRGAGSSPLTRGKRVDKLLEPVCRGLIPAHAGKTLSSPRLISSRRAHPRSRGENELGRVSVGVQSGSSPLTRGKHMLPSWKGPEDRLIPAHAGKTLALPCGPLERAAHPRSRGENTLSGRYHFWYHGSSPLTRGKRAISSSYSAGRGLIPAHAGKTRSSLTGCR